VYHPHQRCARERHRERILALGYMDRHASRLPHSDARANAPATLCRCLQATRPHRRSAVAEESSTHHTIRLPHPDARATAAAHLFKTLALPGQASRTQRLAMVTVEESFARPHEMLETLAIFRPKSRA
jgi:hypothetical protein